MRGRLLIVTQYFLPERFKSNDIAFEMSSRGWSVEVWSGIPNYPEGRYSEGYGVWRRRRETIDGVKIRRLFQTPRGRRNHSFGLAVNYLSYALCGAVRALWAAASGKRFDAVFVHQTSPITQALPAMIYCRLTRTPLYTWVLDLWPESLMAAAGIESRPIIALFERFARRLYRLSTKILISSHGFADSITSKGDFASKTVYFPNWAEELFERAAQSTESDIQYDDRLPQLPEGFVVMFAGNIGTAQDFESVIDAAALLADDPTIWIVVVGDGRNRATAERYAESKGVTNISFVGSYPVEAMPALFSRADVMLLSLARRPLFALTCPAKIQAYMASGKPIVAMIDGEGADVINRSQCGIAVGAGESTELAAAIRRLCSMTTEERAELGRNGAKEYDRQFARSGRMECLDKMMQRDKKQNI